MVVYVLPSNFPDETAFTKMTLFMFPLIIALEELIEPCLSSDLLVDVACLVIKLAITAAALGVAVFVPSFSFLCALVGLICTMSVSIVFPAAAHLRMFGPHLDWQDKLLDLLFVIGGTVMAILGTIVTVTS